MLQFTDYMMVATIIVVLAIISFINRKDWSLLDWIEWAFIFVFTFIFVYLLTT